METRAHHILIGVFSLLVAGAAVVFALWLGKAGHDTRFDLYDVAFDEAVSGLSRGGAVQFNGINIGDVVNLRLDPKDPRRVLARIRVDSTAPIRSNTHARLVYTGITGIAVIRLNSGDDMHSPPLRPAAGEEIPLIVADPSPLSKILADGGDVVSSANELLIQTRKVFSDENVANLSHTLRNLEQTTGAISAQREEFATALKQLTQASQQANTALTEATRMFANTNQLIDGQGKQTMESAQRSMAALERTLLSVDKLIADNRDQLDSGMHGLSDLGPAISELRGVLASLRQIAHRVEDKPAEYLLGNDSTKEFKP